MKKIIYNKLVRDKIPEIIKKDGGTAKIIILKQKEFIKQLFKKLKEEVDELVKVKQEKKELSKEIGDIYEVIEAIIKNLKLNNRRIIKLKNERRKSRGRFSKRIFLKSIDK